MAAKEHTTDLDPKNAAPAVGAEAVTPSDTVELTYVSRGIYVGGTGDVTALMSDGTTVTFKAVPVGVILPIRARRINNTATTATLMVSLY